MAQIRIDEVYPKKELYPMLINFQNGNVTDDFATQECMIFKNINNNQCKTVATVIDKLVYAGEEKSEELSKSFILTRSKRTGKIRLIECSAADMKPILKINDPTPLPMETNNLELSRKFGSKKQKQQMEHREKLKVNVETVTEQMQNITQEVTTDELDLTTYENHNADDFYLPSINRSANSAEEIYDINTILTEEEYEKIHSELQGKEFTSGLVQLIKNIVAKNNLSAKLLVLAVYASCLIELYGTVAKILTQKSFIICPHSVTLNEIIFKKFCTVRNGRRTRPMPYKDKSLCHAIVFILLINGLKIEFAPLCETFKLSDRNASLKMRVTGASIVTSGSKKILQLKLPLNTKAPLRRKSAKF